MELNPYLHYRVHQERSADAVRAAEKWRLLRSLKAQGRSRGWLQRLGFGRLDSVDRDDEVRKPRPGARQSATSPTL